MGKGRDPNKLTAKQEKFVQGIISGKSQRKSYIDAGYKTENKDNKYIDIRASELFKNSKVLVRYKELMGKHEKKALWTREMAIEELKKALLISTEDRTMNSLISAVKELNNLEDLYPKGDKEESKGIEIKLIRSSDVNG